MQIASGIEIKISGAPTQLHNGPASWFERFPDLIKQGFECTVIEGFRYAGNRRMDIPKPSEVVL
ncbi:MAG: hypothetical protein CL696_06560 [Chloroflexi bacterium]|nr:hypothetical protein [Chloroflexota bacterium]